MSDNILGWMREFHDEWFVSTQNCNVILYLTYDEILIHLDKSAIVEIEEILELANDFRRLRIYSSRSYGEIRFDIDE